MQGTNAEEDGGTALGIGRLRDADPERSLYHTTTPGRAAEILDEGFDPSAESIAEERTRRGARGADREYRARWLAERTLERARQEVRPGAPSRRSCVSFWLSPPDRPRRASPHTDPAADPTLRVDGELVCDRTDVVVADSRFVTVVRAAAEEVVAGNARSFDAMEAAAADYWDSADTCTTPAAVEEHGRGHDPPEVLVPGRLSPELVVGSVGIDR